ncbi:hypothetical protein soil367_16925 [Hydrocarboniclastica marina]|uniref:Uncharacterized protein n=2 Tax=Hydrocarboniclastica marina TaxID=2259620 RepID=A0A4P7XK33_9ALTE|nr:hypothetical protein soil367_16925 [Hydrocarboniclastica marina]
MVGAIKLFSWIAMMEARLSSVDVNKADIQLMVELGMSADYMRALQGGTLPLPELDPLKSERSFYELTPTEIEVLRAGGAYGLDDEEDFCLVHYANLRGLIEEGRQFLSQCYDITQTAYLLQVSTDEAEALATQTDPILHTFQLGAGPWFFPRWQFIGSGTVPHLKPLLSVAGASIAPMILSRIMLSKHVDLETETTLCPRDWLVEGLDVEPVLKLMRETSSG